MTDRRCILHADMDAFYAAIEQRDHPQMRGKPVIVGGLGRRGVVATASYEARVFGVHSALPTARARRLCPDGIYVTPRMSVYGSVARQIRAVFEGYTPMVEPLSLDEAFLDVTGSELLFGSGPEIASDLRRRVYEVTGLTVSVGVAATKFVAKVASDLDKPDGLVVVPRGTEVEFLGRLPVRRLWGAGKRTQERFARLGWSTIADVQAAPEARLVEQFGEVLGRHFHRICHGLDPRSVVSRRGPKSISHELTFDQDLVETEKCHRVLLQLSEQVGRRLRRNGLYGQTVRLKLRFPPFVTLSRQKHVEHGTADDLEIYRVVKTLFDAARKPGTPVRLLGVGVSELKFQPGGSQGGLFEPKPEHRQKHKRVLEALDDIQDKFGDGAIGHGAD